MKRRKRLAVAGPAVLLFAAGALVLWPGRDRITRESYDRINDGMSRADVTAILGEPGDYTTGPISHPGSVDPRPEKDWFPPEYVLEVWSGDQGDILVTFDTTGREKWRTWWAAERTEQGPLDNLLWRARRQWRKWFP